MDFRVGGSFTQKMQIAAKEGMCEFSLRGTYEEIVVAEKISYRADLGQAITRVTVEFSDEGDATKVVLTQDGFADESSCQIGSKGTLESLDRLDSMLAEEVPLQRL